MTHGSVRGAVHPGTLVATRGAGANADTRADGRGLPERLPRPAATSCSLWNRGIRARSCGGTCGGAPRRRTPGWCTGKGDSCAFASVRAARHLVGAVQAYRDAYLLRNDPTEPSSRALRPLGSTMRTLPGGSSKAFSAVRCTDPMDASSRALRNRRELSRRVLGIERTPEHPVWTARSTAAVVSFQTTAVVRGERSPSLCGVDGLVPGGLGCGEAVAEAACGIGDGG